MKPFLTKSPGSHMAIERYSERYSKKARDILTHCISEHPGENIFISPLSVLLLLSLAADSTTGSTETELVKYLKTRPGQHQAGMVLGEFQQTLNNTDAFSSANAVCVRSEFAPTVSKEYRDRILPIYDGEIFTGSNMVGDVNQWITDKTREMIKGAANESMKDMLFCLINAVAFESAWAWPFDDSDVKDHYFYNADGTRSRVLMIEGAADSYIENSTYTGFNMQYSTPFSFMALLPKDKETFPELTDLDFTELFHSARQTDVDIRLPEFKFEFSLDLSDFCKEHGINEIWTDHADFSPLSCSPLKMEPMLHKTYIDVNRAGTRAAAVSLGAIEAGCALPTEIKEVYLDRPFLFAIIHNNTGIPVFVGQMNHLEDAKVRPKRLTDRLHRQE